MNIKTVHFVVAMLMVLLLSGMPLSELPMAEVQAAQSTGDSLIFASPTPTALATVAAPATSGPPPPTVTPAKIWVGRIVENRPGVTEGNGSIFRISVEGVPGATIELRSEETVITAEAGDKPEYGPYAAEFAPVTAGTWTVSVPALGVSLLVGADNYNLVEVEFTQIPVAQATQQAVQPAATSGPPAWQGRLTQENWGTGMASARLIVQVEGMTNQAVRLSTLDQVINTANTGQKPELGPDVVEFAGLTPATYIVEPVGLNIRFDVVLKPNVETWVVFSLPPPTLTPVPTATPTAMPQATFTPRPTNTATPIPAATTTATLTPTATAQPSATPVTRWIGAVEARRIIDQAEGSSLVVQVFGISRLSIRLQQQTQAGWIDYRRCVTGQGLVGSDTCLMENLQAGQYRIVPEGLSINLPLTLAPLERATVVFDLDVLEGGVVGWQVRVRENNNIARATENSDSTIVVYVVGRVGQVVALHASAQGEQQFCELSDLPGRGLGCEFTDLEPGVYRVEALNTGASYTLFVDGTAQAIIEFAPNATEQQPTVAPMVGYGVQPRPTPTPNQTETPTPTETATATQLPTRQTVRQIVVTATPLPPTATATLTATVELTPTPAFAWQGRVVEVTDKVAGAIGVRAAGLKDHPVRLRSGGWESPTQLTGVKLELGEYGAEFGGLAQGKYIVELVGLATYTATLGPDQYQLVEFRYDFVATPEPAPAEETPPEAPSE